MSTKDQKDADEKVDGHQRGPTRRQFLTGMAAAGAGLVASGSGTASAASLLARRGGGSLTGPGPRYPQGRRRTHSCSGGCSRRCLLLRQPPTRFERRSWRWACRAGSLMPETTCSLGRRR